MLLSDPSGFMSGQGLDLGSLADMEHPHSDLLDFGNFLSTDNLLPPSSSPNKAGYTVVDYDQAQDIDWSQWDAEMVEAEPDMSGQ